MNARIQRTRKKFTEMLILYLNKINQRLKYLHLFINWMHQLYNYLWSLGFSSYLLILVMFTFLTVVEIKVYIKTILDNLSNSFLIHEINGCSYMILKEVHVIFVSMIICSIVDHLINTSTWRKRSKHYSVLIQKAFL